MKAQYNTFDMNRVNLWEVAPLEVPFLLCIEPTFICNFRCNYCMHALDKGTLESRGFQFGYMDWKTFENILEQIKEFPGTIKKVTFGGYGEPTLDKRLPEMIRLIMETGKVQKTLVVTNGSMLTRELTDQLLNSGLSELKISLQGMTSEKYKQVCGVSLNIDEFFDNIRYFSAHRGDCILRVKVADVALAEGEEQLFYDVFGDICDFVAVEHIYAQFDGVVPEMLPDSGKNRFGFENKKKSVCSVLFFKLSVLQNGTITFGYPDGITYDGFNVNEMTLKEAWNSRERKRLLYDNLIHDKSTRECCESCTRWTSTVTPADDIDGHEAEILSKINVSEYDVDRQTLRKEKILCYDGH